MITESLRSVDDLKVTPTHEFAQSIARRGSSQVTLDARIAIASIISSILCRLTSLDGVFSVFHHLTKRDGSLVNVFILSICHSFILSLSLPPPRVLIGKPEKLFPKAK